LSVPVIILRPQPGADRTREKCEALGLETRLCPLFAARGLAWSCPDPAQFAAVLITSANAARLAGPGRVRYKHLPVFAVGETSAEAAKEAGFEWVVSGEGDVARLVAKISSLGHQSLLHLSGKHVTDVEFQNLKVERRIVYESVELSPSAAMLHMLSEPGVALVHSPRAGARLAAIVLDKAAISIVAISARAATAAGDGWQRLAIADQPRDEAMIARAAQIARL
jgi:uroporphyrinogen-III synthase